MGTETCGLVVILWFRKNPQHLTEVKPADVMTLMFYVVSETELIILQSKLQSTQKVKQTKAHRVISLACLLFSLDLFKVKLKYFYISVNYFPVLSVLVQCVKPTDRHTSCGVSAVTLKLFQTQTLHKMFL